MLAFPGFTNMLMDTLAQELKEDHPLGKLRNKWCQYTRDPLSDIDFATPSIKDNKYNLSLDFRKFKPEEVEIKLGADKMLQISGKHEQMSEDGSSYVYRQYVHHFSVPDNVDHEKLSSKLDGAGVLRVEAPVKNADINQDGSRNIPIEFVKAP